MTASSSASFPERILEQLEDPQVLLVFPSEVTARFWLRRSLAVGGGRAVRAERFLDWGDFKKRWLRYQGNRRAVTRAHRTMFAWRILEENSRNPFFRALVPPEHADSPQAYLGAIVRSLPALARLPALAHRWPEAGAAKREDFLRLLREYRRFLDEGSLYEPSFQSPRLEAGERRFLILFPEVIEDFQEHAPLLEGHPRVSFLAVPPLPAPARALITVHDTLALELERVLGSVADLLDRGTDPEEIVLSVTDLAALEGTLERRAELHGIPLAVHRSHPVTSFPSARLFRQVLAAHTSRLSLGPLKDLLLNRALPWREPALAQGLVRLGLDHRLLRSPPAAGGDAWEGALGRARAVGNPRGLPLPELRSFYRRLRRYLSEICAAPSFRTLKERLTGFARAFLDTARWQPRELGAFQFALDRLDELEEACSGELPALRLWLDYLDHELYLPRVREGGVPVYDYPVAEGIAPSHHFLVNASQEGTRRRLEALPALNPQEEGELQLPERDLGPMHLQLFLHSGAHVQLSYSRRGQSRSHLPPALFATRGSVLEADGAEGAPRGAGHGVAGAGPELRERLTWATGESFPLVGVQQAGFRHAMATALAPRGVDATVEPLAAPRPGRLRVSPTALQS
ncbi:MAG: hypothetical protein JW820_01050, partial [Spirochaetales bacterium]|nr:hypothetical protein [Spirochaetales bacterium]